MARGKVLAAQDCSTPNISHNKRKSTPNTFLLTAMHTLWNMYPTPHTNNKTSF